jgi:hypothetical protein
MTLDGSRGGSKAWIVGDNEFVIMARALAQQSELENAVEQLRPLLGADVIRLRYSLGEDWSGAPAIFFRVLLSDRASTWDALHDSTGRVRDVLVEKLQPVEKWGVLPYFSFRSESEQRVIRDAAWA